MMTQMQAYGAMVVAVEDKAHRWTLLEAGVRRFGWFPTSPFFGPVVGSNPYGIEGYKSLAYGRRAARMAGADWIVCRSVTATLVGAARGFAELVAWVDRSRTAAGGSGIYSSLSQAAGRAATPAIDRALTIPSLARSVRREHVQALKLFASRTPPCVPDDVSSAPRPCLRKGLFVEPSCGGGAAVDLLRRRLIRAGDTVTCLLTAGD
jgi:threonine synthase